MCDRHGCEYCHRPGSEAVTIAGRVWWLCSGCAKTEKRIQRAQIPLSAYSQEMFQYDCDTIFGKRSVT